MRALVAFSTSDASYILASSILSLRKAGDQKGDLPASILQRSVEIVMEVKVRNETGAPAPQTPVVAPHPPRVQPAAPSPTPSVPPSRRTPAPPGRQGVSLQTLRQMGQMRMAGQIESDIHCITIIGQIEGHMVLPPQNKTTKYEHILPQLVAVEQNPKIKGLLILLNTVGGDVEAGLAIAEMINGISKPTVSLVLGGGHSIGVPIAVSARKSFIAETATMTIHPLRLTGMVIGVPQTYEYLDKMQDRIIKFVKEHSRITEEKFRELMFRTGELVRDIGTVLIGRDAVEVGLVDEVGSLGDALRALRGFIDEAEEEKGVAADPQTTGWGENDGKGVDQNGGPER